MIIPESELIINSDGSIYHLHLKPEHLSDRIITVGDPDRVPMVSQYFEEIVYTGRKREFVTHTGYYKGKLLSVISTGMGTDNIEILMTELDALVNVDLQTRIPKPAHTTLKIVRVGTSGSMQLGLPVDSLLASSYGVGLDSLMTFYPISYDSNEKSIASKVQARLKLPFVPYCVKGSEFLIDRLAKDLRQGITVTCPGFFAPQGREVRIKPALPDMMTTLSELSFEEGTLTNFEMETAGYYAMGRLLGHEVLSLNAIVANRVEKTFSQNADEVVNRLILYALENF
ncbi:Purine nucleoside phosphorylase [Lunatimonas lonarensis]|uniref:Purine nucleoside phosphorylase n=1 Tax=Lunatimonas lonarensis TaxID=1232681 RepID=R7ZTD2_9BACT|nr:nucleoside phosphorylase [Lunatimonas lonarensis]EON77254.1 Purine nucleoside phosphorylase [Lunatimonas lonarensis]